MDVAYRVPDNQCEGESPLKKVEKTKPITKMNVKSIIGYPTNNMIVNNNSHVVVRGVAWDDGHGIKAVMISTDEGKTWEEALLDDNSAGDYAYRAFRFSYKPTKTGSVTFMSKAINKEGKEQPFDKDIKWNHGGYKFNGIDKVQVTVV